MKKLLLSLAGLLALLPALALATVNVFATVPEWGALAREIGGDQIKVFTATHALQDPHRIEARPSLLAQARNADLLLANGAELEVGWLPLLLRDGGNSRIQPGKPGYFEAASFVNRLEIPAQIDRAHGDIHAGGNPHIQLDPRNILRVAAALTQRFSEIDPANANIYQTNYKAFGARWQANIVRWEKQAQPLRGVPVMVQHKSFSYLLNWLGMKEVATLEPKPGIEPSSSHLQEILARQQAQPARMVLRAAYQNDKASQWMAEKARIPAIALPFSVGGNAQAKDLSSLFDDSLQRLLHGLQ